ncbi:MAG: hypothetical protein M1569_01005 [Candidatus Marsarchaeota archaeon]|nr:hypothetical protein [Candidatus Marsarchaeota archaeon]MCL5412966.1 hypothetical protein [Candidatus Marsarchaeota archaeon]
MESINNIINTLNRDPSKPNWEKFSKMRKKSGIKYYSIRFSKSKVSRPEDLRKAYADLYDAKENLAYAVPIIMSEGKRIRGATIYLKGLINLNK